MGVPHDDIDSSFCLVETLVALLHTLVVSVDICHLSQEKAPHSAVITVHLFSIAHQLASWSPGRVVNAPVLILHAECLFVSSKMLDVRKCLAFPRHIMMGSALQEHIHITVIGDRGSRQLGISLMLGCMVSTASKEVHGRGFCWCAFTMAAEVGFWLET